MRTIKTQSLLPVFLCAAALVTFACGRGQGGQDHAGQAATAAPSPASQTSQTSQAPAVHQPQSQPPASELRPEPQSVQIHEEAPPTVDQGRDEKAQLDSRERSLAEREAEIAARERRLRQHEQQARSGEIRVTPRPRRPAPAPAPAPMPDQPGDEASAPAPVPVPEPAREEPAPAPVPAPAPPVEAPRTVEVSLPAGTALGVELLDRLASNTSHAGDTFRVRVAQDVREDGVVAIPRGSEIVGVVTEAVPLPRVGGQARLTLRFTDLVLPSGSTVPIHASLIQQGRNETGRDAATIGGAAVGGAILGQILGKGDRGKASVIGAVIGAIAGTAIASKTAGEEVVIPQGTVLGVKLNDPLEVRARVRP